MKTSRRSKRGSVVDSRQLPFSFLVEAEREGQSVPSVDEMASHAHHPLLAEQPGAYVFGLSFDSPAVNA